MKIPPQTFSKALRLLCVAVLTVSAILPAFLPGDLAHAAQITSRSLILEQNSGVTTGASDPSNTAAAITGGASATAGTANDHFKFTIPTRAGIQSIQFEYCTTAEDPTGGSACTTPTDLHTTGATLSATNVGLAGYTLNNSTNGAPYITKAGGSPSANAVEVTLDGVINPSVTNASFFVRITTFTSVDATTGATDAGVVTASTANPIVLTGYMPESLVFCTGQQISTAAGVPNCASATPGAINFDKLFTPTDTAVAVSQMAASTNASSGYVIAVDGTTMTSGTSTITANAAPSASNKGVSQFGMNLRANTSGAAACWPSTCGSSAPLYPLYTPADISAASNTSNLRGEPTSDFATPDTFTYNDGEVVADSGAPTYGSPVPSDAQIYTCSYIVNVPGSQPAGTYTTTLTYIATATF